MKDIQAKKKENWEASLKEYFDMLEEETVDGVIDFDWLLVRTEVEARISGLLEAQNKGMKEAIKEAFRLAFEYEGILSEPAMADKLAELYKKYLTNHE